MSNATADREDVAGVSTLLWHVLYKQYLLLIRYPMNTLAQLLSVYLFFAALFFGGKMAASSVGGGVGALGNTLDGLIVGWFLWTMSITAYFSLAMNITRESSWGTLEQLYMSAYGFGKVMVANVIALLAESAVWGAIILPLMLVTTGRSLAVNLLTVVPIVFFALLSVVGIGFVFGGLALIYKRIENVSQLMQFAIIGLIAAPIANVPSLQYLPLVKGSAMLQRAMQDGVRLWQFPTIDLAILVATGVVYSLAGFYVFKRSSNRARKKGVMGHY